MRGRAGLFRLSLAVLLVALLLGGAGDAHYLLGAIVQFASAILLGAAILVPAFDKNAMITATCALILAAIALAMMHLLPLPAGTLSTLPGQAVAARVLAATGVPPAYRPLTVDRGYTVQAALELLPALAIFVAASRIAPRRLAALAASVVAVGALSAILGGIQRATGTMLLFDSPHMTSASGLFVNRNHQATFLLIAILLVPSAMPVLAPGLRGSMRRIVTVAGILFLAGGTIATTSRAGLIGLPFVVAGAVMLMLEARLRLASLAAGAAVFVVAAASAVQIPAVRLILTRYADGDERRFYWADSLAPIKAFWPWGSGIGTFTRVFPIYEPDARIDGHTVNAAHNDYVQLLLEAGLPAAILIGAGLVLYAWALVRLLRAVAPWPERRLGWAAAGGILVVLLHSIVDYPLRMMSLMAVLGLLAAVLMRVAGEKRQGGDRAASHA